MTKKQHPLRYSILRLRYGTLTPDRRLSKPIASIACVAKYLKLEYKEVVSVLDKHFREQRRTRPPWASAATEEELWELTTEEYMRTHATYTLEDRVVEWKL